MRQAKGAAPPPARLIYLYAKLSFTGDNHVFETIAFLSTVGFAIVFVALIQADRASRRSEDNPKN